MKSLNKSLLWIILIVMAVSFTSWLSHNKPDVFESGTIGVGLSLKNHTYIDQLIYYY